ncbi:SOS response-associated peptidase [Pseudonocardia eucalypti]|uniref:Abasic site processing protein n=1 Tax=Pseudonocardia eucalypti TaxID=648755 RepID=A0ABP9QXD5_9PSEU|nr:putative SOS response-associated peptidase YedK [Pseudonocardia eucalypti]
MARPDEDVAREFDVKVVADESPGPSWNVAPTQSARVVLERLPSKRGAEDAEGVQRMLRTARWGLVPSWAKDLKVGNRLINARSETITEKPAFKAAAARRRCLVPADGYYEWQNTEQGKVPYFLHRDDELLAFAGLYELWPDPDRDEDDPDRWLWSYTILTHPAPDALGHVHDRSPVLVPPGGLRDGWLNPELTDPAKVRELLAAMPEPGLQPRRVSNAVNSPKNNTPDLVAPVSD